MWWPFIRCLSAFTSFRANYFSFDHAGSLYIQSQTVTPKADCWKFLIELFLSFMLIEKVWVTVRPRPETTRLHGELCPPRLKVSPNDAEKQQPSLRSLSQLSRWERILLSRSKRYHGTVWTVSRERRRVSPFSLHNKFPSRARCL